MEPETNPNTTATVPNSTATVPNTTATVPNTTATVPNTTATVPNPSPYLQSTEEVEKIFNRFDANGDGKISTSELANVLKALGSDNSADDVRRMMDDLDTDRDGFINLAEFSKFCKDSAPSDQASGDEGGMRELRDAFDLYDKNRNGFISAAELHLVLSRLGESCSVEDCVRMIQSVDSDGDGNVSFDEFQKMMMNSNANYGSSSN